MLALKKLASRFGDADQSRGPGHQRPEQCVLVPRTSVRSREEMPAAVEGQDERYHPRRTAASSPIGTTKVL